MPVSSFMIHVKNGTVRKSIEQLNGMKGVTVLENKQDKIVALSETSSRKEDRDLWDEIGNLPGVITLNLIYHNHEDLED